ncbi:hypothetical protein NKH77_40760 [Streptomyces sp. M19]
MRGTAARYPPTGGCAASSMNCGRRAPVRPALADGRPRSAPGSAQDRRPPRVGALTLDCDILTVVGSDVRVMVYTAEPGTRDAERLALLSVVGTQTPTG